MTSISICPKNRTTFPCDKSIFRLSDEEIASLYLGKHIGNDIYLAKSNKYRSLYVKYKPYNTYADFEADVCKYASTRLYYSIVKDAWMCDNDYGVIILKENPYINAFIPNPRFFESDSYSEMDDESDYYKREIGCSYNKEEFICEGYGVYGDEIKIPFISEDLLDQIIVGKIIGGGVSGEVYRAKLDDIKLAIKVGNVSEAELCIQNLASKNGIAPKIYSYWKCHYDNEMILIMEEIKGESLEMLLEKGDDNHLIDIFLNIIRTLIYMGMELHIDHNDLHTNNIMITYDYKIVIIDFGRSGRSEYPILSDYRDFIKSFRIHLFNYIKRGKFSNDSNATRILYALKVYKDWKDLIMDRRDTYIDAYNRFETNFFKYLPQTITPEIKRFLHI
jgi:predicted Ser/Thr protein kinase